MATRGRRLSNAARHAIVNYRGKGLSYPKIRHVLKERYSVTTTEKTIKRFIAHYDSTGSIQRKGRVVPPKLTALHREVIHMWMEENPESTASDLRRRIHEDFGIDVSSSHMRRIRRELGWKTARTKYCQLISVRNRRVSKLNAIYGP